jgi:hypothetical protein
MKRGYE